MPAHEIAWLYRRYGPILFSHYFRRLGDEDRAADATHKAFTRLAQRSQLDDAVVMQWVRRLDR